MTDRIIELYKRIQEEAGQINARINQARQGVSGIKAAGYADIPSRIEHLEEVLEKIDEYVLKVKGFQELAKKNLDSQNVLTIEAPPGYRVNLNRLKNWSMMIDPMSDNDPYAQRVLAVAKCDECFLEQKRTEFKSKIEELKNDQVIGLTEEMVQLEKEIEELKEKRAQIASKEEVKELASLLEAERRKYIFETMPVSYSDPEEAPDCYAIGAFAEPFGFGEETKPELERMFGKNYDPENGRLLIPAVFPAEEEMILTVTCTPSRSRHLDSALQNLILNQIEKSPAGSRKICVIDGVRYNSNSMGSLRQLENTFALEPIPRNPERLTAALEEIVSSFADMDDLLELYDSVQEYNQNVPENQRLPRTTLVLFGWPNAYDNHDKEMIRRILINYERYGISCFIVTYDDGTRRETEKSYDLTEYAMQNAVKIKMTSQETTAARQEDTKPFVWYQIEDDLPASYAESVKKRVIEADTTGNEYTKRYSLEDLPPYTREYKKVEMPVGIDGKDQAHSIAFENENFATYLVGASRSGKSTLLHTLIAGLIRNYHPDNVELWLADFKQLEFKRYMRHLPPHVKYVLLDESPELVYDLIDKLTDEMMKRQRLFSRLGKQRLDQIDPRQLDEPLPVIFIVLDEFSIMSQSVAESPIYKLRLQNLLAKGAALGMKFLFSSQTFTTGVTGLTPTARAQIQQRIAMKGSNEEISETLELSSNLKTDQVRNWMDALPPHYALIKYRLGADTLPQVKRLLVMYFEDYAPRDEMIDKIRSSMHAVASYTPDDISSYVDKHPVLVDGNTYEKQDISALLKYKTQYGHGSDEMLLSFGVPRLMTPLKPAILSPETRENILLVARAAEQSCAASILMSVIKAFKAQGGNVQIWAYRRQPLYAEYSSVFSKEGIEIIEGIDAVCDEIRSVKKKIMDKEEDSRLILMIGMDRICMDFDFVDGAGTRNVTAVSDVISQCDKAPVADDEDPLQKYADAWNAYSRERRADLRRKGMSREEIKKLLKEEQKSFDEDYFKNGNEIKEKPVKRQAEREASETNNSTEKQDAASGAYNALEDFVYIMKQGSRNGIHFLMSLNSVADLKQTGVKADFFRHKLLFQISADDSRSLIGNKGASLTPEHICLYDDSLSQFSFRPYIHNGIGWEGWYVDESGELISPFVETEE